jgi:hypothetical protein
MYCGDEVKCMHAEYLMRVHRAVGDMFCVHLCVDFPQAVAAAWE